MKQTGQVVLFRFPHADLQEGKLRPAILLGRLPGEHDDWLVCMISSQLRHSASPALMKSCERVILTSRKAD